MRLVVTGGRNYTDTTRIFAELDAQHEECAITVLIEGEASGLDTRARVWAKRRGVQVAPYPAPWDDIHRPGAVVRFRGDGSAYDAAAGGRRNQQMIDEGKPDFALVFPGGTGTADMKRRIVAAGIPFREVV